MTIILFRHGNAWTACIEEDRGRWGRGLSIQEAIGDLVMRNYVGLNLRQICYSPDEQTTQYLAINPSQRFQPTLPVA